MAVTEYLSEELLQEIHWPNVQYRTACGITCFRGNKKGEDVLFIPSSVDNPNRNEVGNVYKVSITDEKVSFTRFYFINGCLKSEYLTVQIFEERLLNSEFCQNSSNAPKSLKHVTYFSDDQNFAILSSCGSGSVLDDKILLISCPFYMMSSGHFWYPHIVRFMKAHNDQLRRSIAVVPDFHEWKSWNHFRHFDNESLIRRCNVVNEIIEKATKATSCSFHYWTFYGIFFGLYFVFIIYTSYSYFILKSIRVDPLNVHITFLE